VDTDADKKTYTPTVQKQVCLDTRDQLLVLWIWFNLNLGKTFLRTYRSI